MRLLFTLVFEVQKFYINLIVLLCVNLLVPSILGDDAMNVRWTDLSGTLDLYASHVDFLEEVAKFHNASW